VIYFDAAYIAKCYLNEPGAEIGDSRIFIGFHVRTAVRHGANLGRQVGHWTFHRFLRPLGESR